MGFATACSAAPRFDFCSCSFVTAPIVPIITVIGGVPLLELGI
jgi:hypothetical protein